MTPLTASGPKLSRKTVENATSDGFGSNFSRTILIGDNQSPRSPKSAAQVRRQHEVTSSDLIIVEVSSGFLTYAELDFHVFLGEVVAVVDDELAVEDIDHRSNHQITVFVEIAM